MSIRTLSGECLECESTYAIEYMEEMTSSELPEFCPFCGSPIDALSDEAENVDDDDEDLNLDDFT